MAGPYFPHWFCKCGVGLDRPAHGRPGFYGDRVCGKCGSRLEYSSREIIVRWRSTGFWWWQRELEPHPDSAEDYFEVRPTNDTGGDGDG